MLPAYQIDAYQDSPTAREELTGFIALIPAGYTVRGVLTPTYIASTWCMEDTHRNARHTAHASEERLDGRHRHHPPICASRPF